MLLPSHCGLLHNFGMLKLQEDVIKIGAKGLSKQSFDIFKNKSLGLCFADSPHGFRKHIALVVVCLVLPTQRKGLAWRATSYKLNSSRVTIIADSTNIRLEHRPIIYARITIGDVSFYIVAGIFVPLKKRFVVETCLL